MVFGGVSDIEKTIDAGPEELQPAINIEFRQAGMEAGEFRESAIGRKRFNHIPGPESTLKRNLQLHAKVTHGRARRRFYKNGSQAFLARNSTRASL